MTCVALDRAALAFVVGGLDVVPGMNVDQVHGKHVNVERALTDYGYCVATIHETCKTAHGGYLWGTYSKAAAACTFEQVPKVCGQPAPDAQ